MKKQFIKIFIALSFFVITLTAGCEVYVYDDGENGRIVISDDSKNGDSSNEFSNDNNEESNSSNEEEDNKNNEENNQNNSSNNNQENEEIKDDETVEKVSTKFLKGTITLEKTTMETEHFKLEIDKNVYIPGYALEYLEILYDALEEVSGLKFYNEHYNKNKIKIEVEKPNNKFPETEVAGGYAYSIGATIHVSSGDLFIGNSYTIAHELSHILQYSQSSWSYSGVLVEGFAQYNAYKVIKYLENTNMAVARANNMSEAVIKDVSLHGDIYSKTIKYWIENEQETYQISGNGKYSVGMRFMNYLDSVYGNYSKWIKYYESINPYYTNKYVDQKISLDKQFDALVKSYDKNVFDNFYGWLKINNDKIYKDFWNDNNLSYDLTKLQYTYIYPAFNAIGNSTNMNTFYKFSYNNLYINIDETRNYLNVYKNKDVSKLRLVLLDNREVALYDSEDNLIERKIGKEFSLVGVSYIKLIGNNTLGSSGKHGLKILYE